MRPAPVAIWFFVLTLSLFFTGIALQNNTMVALAALSLLVSVVIFTIRYREEKKEWSIKKPSVNVKSDESFIEEEEDTGLTVEPLKPGKEKKNVEC